MSSSGEERIGSLYVNVVGCGYPPDVSCERFYEEYGRTLLQDFSCFYSAVNGTRVLTEYVPEKEIVTIALACIPLLLTLMSAVALLVVPGRMRMKKTRVGPASATEGSARYESLRRLSLNAARAKIMGK